MERDTAVPSHNNQPVGADAAPYICINPAKTPSTLSAQVGVAPEPALVITCPAVPVAPSSVKAPVTASVPELVSVPALVWLSPLAPLCQLLHCAITSRIALLIVAGGQPSAIFTPPTSVLEAAVDDHSLIFVLLILSYP